MVELVTGSNQIDLTNDVERIDKNDSELLNTIIISHCQEDEANGFQYLDDNTIYFTYRDVSRNKTIYLVDESNVTPITTTSWPHVGVTSTGSVVMGRPATLYCGIALKNWKA